MNQHTTYKRSFFNANRHEKRVLYTLFFFAAAPVVLVILSFYALFHNLVLASLGPDISRSFMQQLGLFSLLVLVYYTAFARAAFRFIHRSLGPYDRLLKEIDQILAGRRKGPLFVRKDDIGKDIVDRINLLLEKIDRAPDAG